MMGDEAMTRDTFIMGHPNVCSRTNATRVCNIGLSVFIDYTRELP